MKVSLMYLTGFNRFGGSAQMDHFRSQEICFIYKAETWANAGIVDGKVRDWIKVTNSKTLKQLKRKVQVHYSDS